MEFTVRPATDDDADALTAIARRAKASWGYPRAWLAEWEPQLTVTPASIARDATFVATGGDVTLGFGALSPDGEVEHLWVDPDRQTRGVGRALFARLVEEARRRGLRRVEIDSDPNAIGFYERLGCRLVGSTRADVAGRPRSLPRMAYDVGGSGGDSAR